MQTIELDLIGNGYSLNLQTGVYQSNSHVDIEYNDGDETENRIFNLIKNATEIDSLSDELETHCIDWSSTYHLSKKRGNLLRPLSEFLKGKSILEIGSGMGPITRFLGETGATVLALEGTARRAHATRLRNRDLKNVTVVAESFSKFETQVKFDVITLIGVFEYSSLYFEGVDPFSKILLKCQDMLREDGILIIAIENKLGLKYFAGAPEDHLASGMFGLEDRYDKNTARTFGKSELEKMLQGVGFKTIDFNVPLPDYKLTTSYLTSKAYDREDFDIIGFIQKSFSSDPQLPEYLPFSPELVAKTLKENKLLLEFSNSFLVISSKMKPSVLNPNSIGWHFSTNRRKVFCKSSYFYIDSLNCINVESKPMGYVSEKIIPNMNLIPNSRYLKMPLLEERIWNLLSLDYWKHSELQTIYTEYLNYLRSLSVTKSASTGYELLEGKFLDLIPRNICVDAESNFFAFDLEWVANGLIEIRYLLIRSILSLNSLSLVGCDQDGKRLSYFEFMKLVFQSLKLDINDRELEAFLRLEFDFQTGISVNPLNFEKFSLDFGKTFGRARLTSDAFSISLAERDRATAERDRATAERDRATAERDRATAERDRATAERDSVLESRIWQFLQPYRRFRHFFRITNN